ncbi:dnaJ homolog subfamily C member 24 isoform X3 [Alosa sapidissima]|uniref:dnaJ homolog subfamily C member 24 isoform X3 n=1 Tax=Alosa sapidissima TaxID=34773 RepID=UPI001C09F8AA|nr:dnaJ homolog subfamily C member 24 isoform X3 [Alosa sapidissima]
MTYSCVTVWQTCPVCLKKQDVLPDSTLTEPTDTHQVQAGHRESGRASQSSAETLCLDWTVLLTQELKQSWPVDAQVSLEDMDWDSDTQSYTYGCRCGGEFIIGTEEMEEEATVCCDTCSLSIEIKRTA